MENKLPRYTVEIGIWEAEVLVNACIEKAEREEAEARSWKEYLRAWFEVNDSGASFDRYTLLMRGCKERADYFARQADKWYAIVSGEAQQQNNGD